MTILSPEIEVQEQVREIVALLMKRPITEDIAMLIETYEGFEDLDIVDGNWVLDEQEDDFMGGEEHGWLEFKLLLLLGLPVKQNNWGRLYPGDTIFVLDGTPGDIKIKRRPDIAFMQKQRVKRTKGYIFAAPDIAIEIISPNERPPKIRKKLNEYLTHGVKQVWHVYPTLEKIEIHLPDGTVTTYMKQDVIVVGDLMPGFVLEVAKVFEQDMVDE